MSFVNAQTNYAVARRLILELGPGVALGTAICRVSAAQADGDSVAAFRWSGVLAAMLALRAARPALGQTLH